MPSPSRSLANLSFISSVSDHSDSGFTAFFVGINMCLPSITGGIRVTGGAYTSLSNSGASQNGGASEQDVVGREVGSLPRRNTPHFSSTRSIATVSATAAGHCKRVLVHEKTRWKFN
ncbi:unnamed protein product [Linum trigynum]|uniref:Uncharacterized protein n=1 Tax=Linum trigynum TaxID=586398 RepID=A0AAV2ERQ8_9ROSI